MPDPIRILEAILAAGAVAAVVIFLSAWLWRAPKSSRAGIGWTLGVAAGFLLGVWLLGLWPKWPPLEDTGRFLFVLLPATILVEMIGAVVPGRRVIAPLLRLCVAGLAGRVLLHGSIYISDLDGLETPQWTPLQARWIFAGLAIALALEWQLLLALAQKSASRFVPFSLALTCGGAALAVMLSGYATGGQLGVPLGAALAGAALASLFLPKGQVANGAIGLGVIGLFGLLTIGRFFGELTTLHAILLFTAPLFLSLRELPYVCTWRPALRRPLGIALVALPLAFVVFEAQKSFARNNAPTEVEATEGGEFIGFEK